MRYRGPKRYTSTQLTTVFVLFSRPRITASAPHLCLDVAIDSRPSVVQQNHRHVSCLPGNSLDPRSDSAPKPYLTKMYAAIAAYGVLATDSSVHPWDQSAK